MEPTKSAMYQDCRPMAGSGAGWLAALAAGVGHASTVRPDPSTLGAVGERGSRHEGRDLRHTAASLMIRQGASVKAVPRQLGHATASITLDTYGHLFPDELDALAGRLEDARAEALTSLARTQRGPAVVPIREGAGQ